MASIPASTVPTTNRHLIRWVEKTAELCQPARIHWLDGSEEENTQLCNELVEAGTFLAILAGQLAGGLLSTPLATATLIAVAVLGWIASLRIPPAPPEPDPPAVDANLVRSSAAIVAHSWRNRALFLVICGITWFFALGATLSLPEAFGLEQATAAMAGHVIGRGRLDGTYEKP